MPRESVGFGRINGELIIRTQLNTSHQENVFTLTMSDLTKKQTGYKTLRRRLKARQRAIKVIKTIPKDVKFIRGS